jgi:transcriptional regulator with XRE-family HTH domain
MPGEQRKKGRYSLPIPVRRSLRKLGQDIRAARRRRRIQAAILAERAGISSPTLWKIEKGDSGVSIGMYACVLFSLGMIERLADLSDARHDDLGLMLEEEKLPERIRGSSKNTTTKTEP